MSSNPLNDLSQVYLDQVANFKKAENEADIKRWEDLGGPTPTNYKPTGASAKLSKESKEWKVKSDWRRDIVTVDLLAHRRWGRYCQTSPSFAIAHQ